MKSKRIKNKLVFNKRTVTNLSDAHMNQANGGLPWTDPRVCCQPTIYTDCYSCEITCNTYCQNPCTVPETVAYPCPYETEGCVTGQSCA